MDKVEELVTDIDCISLNNDNDVDHLGECPIWNHVEKLIYWKDMERGLLRSFDPISKEFKTYRLSEPFGFIVNSEKGGLISALRSRLIRVKTSPIFSEEEMNIYPLKNKESLSKFNDGKCDWQGRLWFGTSDKKLSNPTAEYFMMDSSLNVVKKEENITIFNGPTFSLDSKYYYFADSPTQTIYRYDFDKETGNLTNKISYLKIEEGYPDGATIDSEGNLWWAIYGASKILKISTKNCEKGEVVGFLKVPVDNPSSVVFGGENLSTLYVTSISYQSFYEKQLPYPNGSLLAINMEKLGIKGVKEAFFKEN